MYVIVAPGLKKIVNSEQERDCYKTIYPYAKIRWFKTFEECHKFISTNHNSHNIQQLSHYGATFSNLTVTMEYFISTHNHTLYYNFRVPSNIRIFSDDANTFIENKSGFITARMQKVNTDDSLISGHMTAIYQGLHLIGDFADVDIIVPDFSIFFAVTQYTGNSRYIIKVQDLIKDRLGSVSFTLK